MYLIYLLLHFRNTKLYLNQIEIRIESFSTIFGAIVRIQLKNGNSPEDFEYIVNQLTIDIWKIAKQRLIKGQLVES